jgi:VWFA-related protein
MASRPVFACHALATKATKITKVFVVFLVLVIFVDKPWHAQERVFRSGVDGVTITVSVRRNHRLVTGLTADDFELTDNGVRQDLSTIAAEKLPLDLTLLLDLSSSVDGPLLQRLKTAVGDTAALLRADDRIRLVAISQVLREVFSLRTRDHAMPLDSLAAEGATALYDGMAATMMRPTDAGRRQLIVAFTDGRDSTSIIDEKTAKEIARITDAVVDIVVPVAAAAVDTGSRRLSQRSGSIDSLPGGDNVAIGGRGPQNRIGDQGVPPVLADLVGPTSGQVFPLAVNDSVSHVFKAMLDDFRASYVLQYVPQGVAGEGWHEVSVAVKKHPTYDIRARKGYKGRSKITVTEVIR